MLVRKLDECMSSSAEKKVSDGFSDVNEMVRWTSRANDSSDLILLSIDWSDVNWSGCACGAECDIISLGIWKSYNFQVVFSLFSTVEFFWYSPRDRSFGNIQRSISIRTHLIWVLAYGLCSLLSIYRRLRHWLLMSNYCQLTVFDSGYRLGVHKVLHV